MICVKVNTAVPLPPPLPLCLTSTSSTSWQSPLPHSTPRWLPSPTQPTHRWLTLSPVPRPLEKSPALFFLETHGRNNPSS